MSTLFQKVLTCADSNIATDAFFLDAETCPTHSDLSWSVRKYTLRGGLQEGVDVVEIDNGKLCFLVLPTRGMGIWKAASGDLRLGWDSPVKDPVHPAYVNLQERGGLGWLKGFNEWIVRCGLSSIGAPGPDVMIDNNGNRAEEMLTLHGKIANIPARKVSIEITEEEIILRGELDETMLFGPALRLKTEIRTAFGSGQLTINDAVTNMGAQVTEHELLYHINYGTPLLEPGARAVCPVKQMAPRDPRAAKGMPDYDLYRPAETGFVEQCYFFELLGDSQNQETAVMLKNAAGDAASVVRYSLKDFPCFTLWKNTAAKADGYVTGLEPATAYPNSRQFERERGRVITLAGGETRATSLSVEVLTTASEVEGVEAEIASLQKLASPQIHAEAIAAYSQI